MTVAHKLVTYLLGPSFRHCSVAGSNTIGVHHVAAALAVVGLIGKEGVVIRKTLPVFAYYALLLGAIGYSIVWWQAKRAGNSK